MEEMELLRELNKVNKFGVQNPDSFNINADEPISQNSDAHSLFMKEYQALSNPGQVTESDTGMVQDFLGNVVWGTASGASWGALDVAALTEKGQAAREKIAFGTYRPWEEQSASGRVGYILGQGLGMAFSFGWAGKLLGAGSNTLSKVASPISKGLQKRMGSELADKYATATVTNNIPKAFQIVGEGVEAGSKEAFEAGLQPYIKIGQEMLSEVGNRGVFKNNMQAITKATDDISAAILKEGGEKISTEAAQELASGIVQKALKYNSRDYHKLIGMGTERLADALPLGMKNKTFKAVVDAALAEATLGITYHSAGQLIKMGTEEAMKRVYGEKGTIDDSLLNLPQNEEHRIALKGDLGERIRNIQHHALMFGITGPARLIKGGRVGLWDDIKNNWSAVRKSYTPIKNMTRGEMGNALHFIDQVSKVPGASKGEVSLLFEKALGKKSLLDYAADKGVKTKELRKMMFDTRKEFGKRLRNNIGSELMRDVWGSTPRMLAGGVAMNIPAFADYYKATGGDWKVWNALGSDTPEILTNMMMGMVLSKGGRSTHNTEGGFWMFEHSTKGPKRFLGPGGGKDYEQRVLASREAVDQMQKSLSMLEPLQKTGFFREQSNGQNIIKTKLLKTSSYEGIDEVLGKEYTHMEEIGDVGPDSQSFELAGMDWVRSLPADQQADAQRKYNKALKVFNHYDNHVVSKDYLQKLMSKDGAGQVIKELNSIPAVRDSKDIDMTLREIEAEAIVKTSDTYSAATGNFVRDVYQQLTGQTIEFDSNGRMTIPDFTNINGAKFQSKDGVIIADVLNTLVRDGVADGTIKLGGKRELADLTPERVAMIEKAFTNANETMQYEIWGNQEHNYIDKYILSDRTMRAAYVQGRTLEQSINAASIFSDISLNKMTFLDKEASQRLRDKLQEIRVGSNTSILIGDSNASAEAIAEANTFLTRVKELHAASGGNADKGVSEISLEKINELKKVAEGTLGIDTFSDKGFSDVKNYMQSEFINNLRLLDSDARFSISQGISSLITDFSSSGSSASPIRDYFATKRNGRYEMPSSKELERFLINDGQDVDVVNELMQFYRTLESAVDAAGTSNMLKFSGGENTLKTIKNAVGKDAVGTEMVAFLRRSQARYALGGIKDVSALGGKIANSLKENKSLIADNEFVNQNLKDEGVKKIGALLKELDDIKNHISDLFILRDYERIAQLTSITKSDFVDQINKFIQKATKEGVDTFDAALAKAWKNNALTTHFLTDIQNNLAGNETNYHLLRENIKKELDKVRPELKDKHHEMDVTTTIDKFANNYNLPTSDVQTIIKNTSDIYESYMKQGDEAGALGILYDTADILIERATTGYSPEMGPAVMPDAKPLTSDLVTDVLQIMHASTKREVKKLAYHGTHLEFSKDRVIDAGHGIMKMFDLIGSSDWYLMDKVIKSPVTLKDGTQTWKDDILPSNQESIDMDARLQSGELQKDSRRTRVQAMLEGTSDAELKSIAENVVEKEAMTRVYLNESVTLLVPTEKAVNYVRESLSEGGKIKELKDLLGQDIDPRFTSKDMSNTDLADAIQMIYQSVTMPLYTKAEAQKADANLVKRRKLIGSLNGKVLEDNYYGLLRHVYNKVDTNTDPWIKEITTQLDRIGDAAGVKKKQKYLVINDESDGSVFDSNRILDKFLNDRAADHNLTAEQIKQVKDRHAKVAKSATDAPTYLTKEDYLLFLSTIGARREWFNLDGDGNISSVKIGAIKPKVGYSEVMQDGAVSMFYNKTAFFYDPIIDLMLKEAGADALAFNTGAKVNRHRKAGETDGGFAKMIDTPGNVKNTMVENIGDYINSSTNSDMIIEVPYNATTIGNLSREHNANFGANIGVHLPHDLGVRDHIGLDKTLHTFGTVLRQMNTNPENLTGITQKLLDLKRIEGDNYLNSSPLEAVMETSGLILDSWMGDMSADKLFTHFFSQSKIASGEAFSSDYAPMAPDLHGKISEQSLPIRLVESNKSINGMTSEKYSQRFFGTYSPSSRHMSMDFSRFGIHDGSDPGSGGFFIFSGKKFKGMFEDTEISSDMIVIPELGQGREGKKFTIMVDGYELMENGSLRDPLASSKKGDPKPKDLEKLGNKDSKDYNAKVRKDILDEYKALDDLISKEIDDIRKASEHGEEVALTNYQVQNLIDNLGFTNKINIGMANNRQPRNEINDIVINKVVPPSKTKGAGVQGDVLPLDPKGRTKGSVYRDSSGKKIYDVHVDMREHPTIKSADGEPLDIWIVSPGLNNRYIPIEAQRQLESMQQGAIARGGKLRFAKKIKRRKDGSYILRDMFINKDGKRRGDDKVIYIEGSDAHKKLIRELKDQAVNYVEEHTDVGNIGRQNIIDAISPQDADFDFDKSSAYGAMPSRLLFEAAARSGYGARQSNLNLLLERFDTNIQNSADIRNWGSVQQQSLVTRGRFVKLHNIFTYLQNAIGMNGELGRVKMGTQEYTLRMKDVDAYLDAVGEISGATKEFIDSYEKPPSADQIEMFISDIFFGTRKGRSWSSEAGRDFNGIFEMVDTKNEQKVLSIRDRDSVRDFINFKVISPLSKYLRYNRGEVSDGVSSKALKLKDIYFGRLDLENSFDPKNNWNTKLGKTDDTDLSVDLTSGIKQVQDYFKISRNPFDIATDQLARIYNSNYSRKNANDTFGISKILLQAENKLLNETDYSSTLASDLYKYVKQEGSFVELSKLNDKIRYLKSQESYLSNSKYDREAELQSVRKSLNELNEAASDLQMVLGSEIDKMQDINKVTFNKGFGANEYNAGKNTYVVWDSKGKNIKQVIRKGSTNRLPIAKSDIAIMNGRRFEITHPEQNRILKSKYQAFNTMPTSGDVVFDRNKMESVIKPLYDSFRDEFSALTDVHKGDPMALSVARRNLVHQYLTGGNQTKHGLSISPTDPLAVEALVYRMLSPEINRKVVAQYKIHDGYDAYDAAYYEVPGISKAVMTYLNEASNKTNFTKLHHDTAMMFGDVLRKVISMQSRAYMNNSYDRLPLMNMDFSYNPKNRLMNRLKNASLNRDVKTGLGADHQIRAINEFINGERYLSPTDAYRYAEDIRASQRGPEGVSDIIVNNRSKKLKNDQIVENEFMGRSRKLGFKKRKEILRDGAEFYRKISKSCTK